MNFKNFKSGIYIQEKEYKSFLPEKINHIWVWDDPLQLDTFFPFFPLNL